MADLVFAGPGALFPTTQSPAIFLIYVGLVTRLVKTPGVERFLRENATITNNWGTEFRLRLVETLIVAFASAPVSAIVSRCSTKLSHPM